MSYAPIKNLMAQLGKSDNHEGSEFSTIQRAVNDIFKEKTKNEQKMRLQSDHIKESFLSKILLGNIEMTPDNIKYLNTYNINLKNRYFIVVLFNIMELGVALDERGNIDWESYRTA